MKTKSQPPVWLRSLSAPPDKSKTSEQALQELIESLRQNAPSPAERKRPFLPRLFHGDRAGE